MLYRVLNRVGSFRVGSGLFGSGSGSGRVGSTNLNFRVFSGIFGSFRVFPTLKIDACRLIIQISKQKGVGNEGKLIKSTELRAMVLTVPSHGGLDTVSLQLNL